ncbi:unnamed protein product, partial [Nesidiocoris tenuis]
CRGGAIGRNGFPKEDLLQAEEDPDWKADASPAEAGCPANGERTPPTAASREPAPAAIASDASSAAPRTARTRERDRKPREHWTPSANSHRQISRLCLAGRAGRSVNGRIGAGADMIGP